MFTGTYNSFWITYSFQLNSSESTYFYRYYSTSSFIYPFRDDDSGTESSSSDDLADDDEEYGKSKTSPKKRKLKKVIKNKRKKKKFAKKQVTSVKEEFSDLPEFERPNGGWVQEYKFTCNRCQPQEGEDGNKQLIVVIGFEASVEHMTEKHGQFATPDKQFQVKSENGISTMMGKCYVF